MVEDIIGHHVIGDPISAAPSLAERHVGHLTIIIQVWQPLTDGRPALPKDRLPIRHGSWAYQGRRGQVQAMDRTTCYG